METWSSHQGEVRKLLLVEDEAIIALAEEKLLIRNGFDVTRVLNGADAVEAIRTNPAIQLVLMDIDLGSGMDGTDAAAEILTIRPLPIVFLTSHTEREYVERVKQITRYGYVLKSAGEFVLVEAINMAFELFRARQVAEHSRRRYQGIFEYANDAIFLERLDDTIVDVNPRACELMGYRREELLTLSVPDLQAPHQRGEAGTVVRNEVNQFGGDPFPAVNVRKDGTEIPVEVTTALLDEDMVISVVRDMRPRQQTGQGISIT